MRPNKQFLGIVLCGLFFWLSGCMSLPSKVTRSNLNDAFRNGDIRLDCMFLCSGKFGANLQDIHQLYLLERWHDLSTKVLEIGFNQDLAYFYLGRAAEGIGEFKAAEIYYLLSQSAPRCILNGCKGLSLPSLATDRLANLKKQHITSEVSASSAAQPVKVDSSSKISSTPALSENINYQSTKECEIDSNCDINQTCESTNNNNFECISKAQLTNPESESFQKKDKFKEPRNEIKLISVGGVYEIPVLLNDVLKINVIIDSGAADVSIAPDVALTLMRTGTIQKSDWLSGQIYQFADGSIANSKRFKLKSVKIGSKTLKNVTCSIAGTIQAPMLLGQSVLKKLGRYTIDYEKEVIQFE